MNEFDDIGVTAAMLELIDSVESNSHNVNPPNPNPAQEQATNQNLITEAKRVPHGQPQQQVAVLRQRIETLSDSIHIAIARERAGRRQHVRQQLEVTKRRLDILWKQNFKVGDNVLVKCKGDKNLPSRPGLIIEVTPSAYKVVLKCNSPTDQKGGTLPLAIERSRSNKTGRYLRIRSGVAPSKTTAKERQRLGSAYALLAANKLPGMLVILILIYYFPLKPVYEVWTTCSKPAHTLHLQLFCLAIQEINAVLWRWRSNVKGMS